MDELGSAPRIQFGDNDQYTTDADQNGSWFGLAISGLKFLINNQHNNNINHNLNPPQSSSNMNNPNFSSSTSSKSNSAKNQNQQNFTKKMTETSQKPKKLHILGPSVFKKQLYDIPEYQSTSDNNKRGKKGNKRSIRTTSKLTKQALAQFNGNFTNYWNQRSSLHSHYGSSNGDHADDDMTSNAGSRHTNDTNNNTAKTAATLTDGGSSTMHHHTDEHNPSMTSSQIIHPTQDKPPKLNHSRSFPLLHSAEYIQDFQKFTFTEDKDRDIDIGYDQEGQCIMNIPSPPPVSSTPDINSSVLLPKIKNVHAIKSWESVHSSNIGSVKSFPDDNSEHGMQAFNDGKLLTSGQGQINHSLTQLIVSDDHFIKEKQQSAIAQKQWLRQNLTAMKPKSIKGSKNNGSIDSSFSGGSTNTNTTGLVHIHQDHGSKTQSELDWTECNDTIIGQVISRPIPQSIKKKKRKKNKSKDRNNNGNDSDWSNVSSNMGVTTPTTTQQ